MTYSGKWSGIFPRRYRMRRQTLLPLAIAVLNGLAFTAFAIAKLPHIASLLADDAAAAADHAELVVFGHSDAHAPGIAQSLRDDHIIIDLSGCSPAVQAHRNYHGICW